MGKGSLLNSKQFRAPLVVGLKDPEGLGGFWEWYDSSPPQLRAQAYAPARVTLSRLASFGAPASIHANPTVKAMIPKAQMATPTTSGRSASGENVGLLAKGDLDDARRSVRAGL